MTKKAPYLILGVITLAVGLFVFWSAGQEANAPSSVPGDSTPSSGITYYYGSTCPHCQDVLKFISDNKIDKKVSFEKKEVYNNKVNSTEMLAQAAKCGIGQSEVGVPFVYANGSCYIGAPDVEEFFRREAGL